MSKRIISIALLRGASAGQKVKCVCLYTSLDSGISRGGVISRMLMLHKSLVEVDLCIISVNPF